MARITVEDCLMHVENRFELVLVASKRARELLGGSEPKLKTKTGDKFTVVALRELAAGLLTEQEIPSPDESETVLAAEAGTD